MATKPAKTVKVTLVYGYAVTASGFHDVKQGEKLEFTSPQGSVDLVLMPKELFSTNKYKTGDPPILVLESGRAKIWCGGSFQVPKQPKWPETGVVTIKPKRGQYGSHSENP